MKWNDDHLVAYIQSSNIDQSQIHEHCQTHLPPHMIPSKFIILDRFPLNSNGKVDRKRLPLPDFSHQSTEHLLTHDLQLSALTNDTEIIIHDIWCHLFQQTQISHQTNIFTIGGHSLLLMQLHQIYKTRFHLESNNLSIIDLFQHPTIIQHAQLIHQALHQTIEVDDRWCSLHLSQARASFAQERIFLDEHIRFSSTDDNSSSSSNNNMYVIPLIYRISSSTDSISIIRLRHAFEHVLAKHHILRTALYLDVNGMIMQHCLNLSHIINHTNIINHFSIVNLDHDHENMNRKVKEILNDPNLFDLSKGHVIRCHILCQHASNNHHHHDILTNDDLILITIHHSVFDGASTSTFLRDLSLAYQSDESLSVDDDDDDTLQYIDYSVHEYSMDMRSSQQFWYSQLEEYNLKQSLRLPFDRHRSSTNQRSGLASVIHISFDNNISASFLNYASSHQLTPFQLGLATFYTFLFKLTHNQNDLCIACINANRYRAELQNMIGMFVSTLPYRLQLDSDWSFDELVEHVQKKC
ncbi:unnamed protein product, partial [Adineta steineri]